MSAAEPAVGIDLGTTYSAVAWVDESGEPRIIPDERGEPLTPSVVSFVGGEPVVGAEAKAHQAEGSADVMYLFKRSMGIANYELPINGRIWTPVSLSAQVLGKLKRQAEAALGREIRRAVITVPEYFTHPERSATVQAGEEAGLGVMRIISEPTAAALAYGLRPGPQTRRVMVYDLGGGTFDISLVEIGPAQIRVLGSEGNHELGGRDWDERLASLVLAAVPEHAEALEDDSGALLVEVERVKWALSARQSAVLRMVAGDRAVSARIARVDFETATRHLLELTGELTSKVLEEHHIGWRDIDGVLPVGGSTRMPMVQRYIEEISGRGPMGGVHPDQAVALGAAAQAAILLEEEQCRELRIGEPSRPILRLGAPRKIVDATAHSLGMIAESPTGDRYVNSVLLKRGQPIPCEDTRPYQFQLDGSGSDLLEVFLTQGETDDPATCVYLGRYVVTGFPPGSGGACVVDVTYAYDDNAIVDVAAIERSTATKLRIEVRPVPEDVPRRFLEPPRRTTHREPMTVYLAFDLSGSMTGPPLAEAQKAARTFVSQLDLTTTAVGIIAFSDWVHTDLAACSNAAQIGRAIDALRVGSTGGGNATHPFDELHQLLASVAGRRFGVVLADGVWERQPVAVGQAKRCHAAGIDVVAIGFGGADQKFLRDIASSDEQALFTRLESLTEVFGTIAREMTEGKPRR